MPFKGLVPISSDTGFSLKPSEKTRKKSLRKFSVRVKLLTGQRIEYQAVAGNSISVLERAIEIYGVCRIFVTPTLRRVK